MRSGSLMSAPPLGRFTLHRPRERQHRCSSVNPTRRVELQQGYLRVSAGDRKPHGRFRRPASAGLDLVPDAGDRQSASSQRARIQDA